MTHTTPQTQNELVALNAALVQWVLKARVENALNRAMFECWLRVEQAKVQDRLAKSYSILAQMIALS